MGLFLFYILEQKKWFLHKFNYFCINVINWQDKNTLYYAVNYKLPLHLKVFYQISF
ncbi:hypothetical protein UDIV_6020 [Ureaplasma diversum NCTC 246]|uniref:Uncharacterized protein n=1 Tax=Ureaplasma diversum NCTC 246 TaxID=1188241 RepID=A0A084EWW8_9BACT|nr:hypothetical protein UDIV_6020 [Ureaplasma diversum NCTC 246]